MDVTEGKDAQSLLHHFLAHDPEGNEMEIFGRK